MNPKEAQARLTKRATTAMLDALVAVTDDPEICPAAIGVLAGVLIIAHPDPAKALDTVNAVTRGIPDGSLLG